MALQKALTTIYGFVAHDAYHRVEGICFPAKDQMAFRVRSYKEPGVAHFADTEQICSYDINGDNPWQQAYEHLKTLPEFEGATDC